MPERQPLDVALVLDRSWSMKGEKLAEAQAAALTPVNHLELAGDDQAGVVSFASEASLDQKLTDDRSRIEAAIDALYADGGTNIAAGVIKATQELTSRRHNPAATSVLILLTDGQAKGEEAAALEAAARARERGILVITVGLGADVNATLLRAMASSEAHYYFAPSSADLAAIYEAMAWKLTCTHLPPSNLPTPTATTTAPPDMPTEIPTLPPPSAAPGSTEIPILPPPGAAPGSDD